MKMKSLSSAVAIAMLAIAGSALADEPASIASYKAEVAKRVDVILTAMDRYDHDLARAASERQLNKEYKAETSAKRQKAEKVIRDLETLKQEFENSKMELVKSLADAQSKAGQNPHKIAPAALIGLLTAQIAEKDKEIKQKDYDGQIRGKQALYDMEAQRDKHADDNIAKTNKEIADLIVKLQTLATGLSDIGGIPSPTRDPKVLEKDPKTNKYRLEWGPVLARFIKDHINGSASKRNWKGIQVTVQVSWSQADFAAGHGAAVRVTAAAPST
jgi:hypothetical protein